MSFIVKLGNRRRSHMRKMAAYFAALSLLLVACGGSTAVSTDQASDEADAPTSTSATTATEESADASQGDDDPMAEQPDEVGDVVDDSTDTDDDTTTVSSIDDVPQVCQDLMAEFLRDIEPIVSPIDWDNATMADFNQVSADFEPLADKFDADSEATGECDDIDMDEDGSLDILIDFAQDKAPGTVGFLTFLNGLMGEVVDPITPDADAGFSSCDEAIEYMDSLMAEYESGADIPINEFTQVAGVATVFFSCTPEQLEYFDSDEVNAFFDGFFG